MMRAVALCGYCGAGLRRRPTARQRVICPSCAAFLGPLDVSSLAEVAKAIAELAVVYLRAGGIQARAGGDGSVVLSSGAVLSADELDRDFDGVVGQVLLRDGKVALGEVVEEQLTRRGLEAVVHAGDGGVAVVVQGEVVAIVTPFSCNLGSGSVIDGDFFDAADAEAWERLVATLQPTVHERPERPAPRPVSELEPETLTAVQTLPKGVRARMVRASQRLRSHRSMAIGHRVEIVVGDAMLALLPVRFGAPPNHPLEFPFEFTRGKRWVRGAIRLKAPKDPLAIVAQSNAKRPFIEQAWAAALDRAADLTCPPQGPRPAKSRGPAQTGPSRGPAARPAASRAGSDRRLSDRLSPSWQPTGQTGELLRHYVIGHRRRLRAGSSASPAQRAAAERHGITLKAVGQTWVQPHLRGAGPDAVLTFRWTPDAELRKALNL